MRIPFVVGNWKLHKSIADATALVTELKNQLSSVRDVQVGVAPVFTAIHAVAKRLEGSTIAVAGQDCFYEEKGAWTGEVGPSFLADAGATWAIIGHSERRQFFGETDDAVGKKVRAALAAGLGVIACVGETDAQRDAGATFAVVDQHLGGALAHVTAAQADRVVIAYEPVWAIGTGRTATPAQAQEVHAHIRAHLRAKLGNAAGDAIRIQYGGSVKPANAEALMSQPDIDGALVGGASLEAADFVAIVKAARPR
ncbi:MAG TPA: triose-phosphate isomerase [Kofleriaceae bacterium]|jgi:triosephosphate isomerase|nr:triose-phosphate isomerase [Kofleriaceae bacterium]